MSPKYMVLRSLLTCLSLYHGSLDDSSIYYLFRLGIISPLNIRTLSIATLPMFGERDSLSNKGAQNAHGAYFYGRNTVL